MVKIKYKSPEEVEKERILADKRKKVGGLAKEVFGFFVGVSESSCLGGLVYLSRFFGFPFNFGNIASIDVSLDKMELNLPQYEEKSKEFAERYCGIFGGTGLTINANYTEPKNFD